ncbi:hypothetical protein PanWU01x14_361880 [Parasponia andersonii]|uniref:DUF4283 domain-containing protein n=1 Tax=Parasponia andersonii TaxID=3476 RepID=A0A2P5A762_PARAD|nr:hypothetical protein PanWU01x14_361880 [Parasponia andersonii]
MDSEEIEKLCERLNMDDHDEPVVQMAPDLIEEGKEKLDLCLVGKVFGNKIVNLEGPNDVAERVWRTSRRIKVEAMGISNIFMFHFGCKDDRQRVLFGGPWNFNNQIISLLKPTGIGMISAMDFSEVLFWIKFLNVPIICRSDLCAMLWGEMVGPMEEVESEGPVLRARVSIDITKPLCRGLKILIDDSNELGTILI